MRASLTIITMAMVLAACGGPPTDASSAPSAGGTPATRAPATSPPRPTPTEDPTAALAEHVVLAIDELEGLAQEGDSNGVVEWTIEEGRWVTDNTGALIGTGSALKDYPTKFLELLTAATEDGDVLAAAEALMAYRDTIGRLAPDVAATEVPRIPLAEEHGFTFFGGDTPYVEFAVVMENKNAEWYMEDVTINVTFLTADGSVAGSENESISVGLPGKFAVGGTSFPEGGDVESMTVNIRGDWQELDFEPGHFEITNVKSSGDRFGVTTTGLISSTFEDELELVEVAVAYRNDGNAIVGGSRTFVDFVPNDGTTVSFESTTLGAIKGIAATEAYATP